MLFRKKMPRSCEYCTHGTPLDACETLCVKRGVVSSDKPCRHFSYDPCKRVPPKHKTPDFHKYSEDDFKL